MKTTASLLTLFLLIAVSISCKKNEDLSLGEGINGSWVLRENTEGEQGQWVSVYQKNRQLAGDSPGYIFDADGTLTVRQNSGWCGTPLISYADYKGTWSQSGSEIQLSYNTWAGDKDIRLAIVALNGRQLELQYVD